MISLLLGIYATELAPAPTRSYFPSFTKVALVVGITLAYMATNVSAACTCSCDCYHHTLRTLDLKDCRNHCIQVLGCSNYQCTQDDL